MSQLHTLPLPAGDLRPVQGSRQFLGTRRFQVAGERIDQTMGDGEALLLVLSGTFDLQAGGSQWLQRGVRGDVFGGKACCVFLPAGCPYRASNGHGEILVVTARVPELQPETSQPDGLLSLSALLPIAGSGKAFDPTTGDWRRQEDFALAPEAILPRRIQTVDLGGLPADVLLPASYKAFALCAAEAVVPAGRTLQWPDWQREAGGRLRRWDHETLLFVRAEGEARVEHAGGAVTVRGDGLVLAADVGPCAVTATGGRAYVAAFFAGPDKAGARVPA